MRFTPRISGQRHATVRVEHTPTIEDVIEIVLLHALREGWYFGKGDIASVFPLNRHQIEVIVRDHYFQLGESEADFDMGTDAHREQAYRLARAAVLAAFPEESR